MIRFKIFFPHVFLSLLLVENLRLIFKIYKFIIYSSHWFLGKLYVLHFRFARFIFIIIIFFYAKQFARFKNQLKLKTKNPLSLIHYFLLRSSKTYANRFGFSKIVILLVLSYSGVKSSVSVQISSTQKVSLDDYKIF